MFNICIKKSVQQVSVFCGRERFENPQEQTLFCHPGESQDPEGSVILEFRVREEYPGSRLILFLRQKKIWILFWFNPSWAGMTIIRKTRVFQDDNIGKAWFLAGPRYAECFGEERVYLFELVETESLGDECPEVLRRSSHRA